MKVVINPVGDSGRPQNTYASTYAEAPEYIPFFYLFNSRRLPLPPANVPR